MSLHYLHRAASWLAALWLMFPILVHAGQDAEWLTFKQRFLQQDGRIIDNVQGNISHSEGQGVAMLLAVHYNDRAAFDSLWHWTRKTLQVRQDKLLAWRWSPKEGISDLNNATDGDLYVAWSLVRAYDQWKDEEFRIEATNILSSVRGKLIRQDKRGLLLLPGSYGFVKKDELVLNLSYWVFPAFDDFEKFDKDPAWGSLGQTGVNLLLEGHFGRWGLPSDWVKLDEKLELPQGFSTRFGYDAVRIPLYLLWAARDTQELMKPFRDYWGYFNGARFIPAWTNLTDDSIDSWDASEGIKAIAALTTLQNNPVTIPVLTNTENYYSASLLLLSKMMLDERRVRK